MSKTETTSPRRTVASLGKDFEQWTADFEVRLENTIEFVLGEFERISAEQNQRFENLSDGLAHLEDLLHIGGSLRDPEAEKPVVTAETVSYSDAVEPVAFEDLMNGGHDEVNQRSNYLHEYHDSGLAGHEPEWAWDDYEGQICLVCDSKVAEDLAPLFEDVLEDDFYVEEEKGTPVSGVVFQGNPAPTDDSARRIGVAVAAALAEAGLL